MELSSRISAFEKLGIFLREHHTGDFSALHTEHGLFEKLIYQVKNHNGWFTESQVKYAVTSIGDSLTPENLKTWTDAYPELKDEEGPRKKVLVIMAGNIPLVGFHDFISVLISGNMFMGKVSSEDHLLLPFLAAVLLQFEPRFKEQIEFTDTRVKKLDAVIATGSNNSSRYFDYYFGKYPHIIRKNRHSAAILDGTETPDDFQKLGSDIFQYYGLGCRNVSKLFVPQGYKFDSFFEGIYRYSTVLESNKYMNNYEYNKTIYLLNSEKLLDNNFLILREDISLSSPIGVLFYEYYSDSVALDTRLGMDKPFIQCLVSNQGNWNGSLPFGQTQYPALWEYADGVDTLRFLTGLK